MIIKVIVNHSNYTILMLTIANIIIIILIMMI